MTNLARAALPARQRGAHKTQAGTKTAPALGSTGTGTDRGLVGPSNSDEFMASRLMAQSSEQRTTKDVLNCVLMFAVIVPPALLCAQLRSSCPGLPRPSANTTSKSARQQYKHLTCAVPMQHLWDQTTPFWPKITHTRMAMQTKFVVWRAFWPTNGPGHLALAGADLALQWLGSLVAHPAKALVRALRGALALHLANTCHAVLACAHGRAATIDLAAVDLTRIYCILPKPHASTSRISVPPQTDLRLHRSLCVGAGLGWCHGAGSCLRAVHEPPAAVPEPRLPRSTDNHTL